MGDTCHSMAPPMSQWSCTKTHRLWLLIVKPGLWALWALTRLTSGTVRALPTTCGRPPRDSVATCTPMAPSAEWVTPTTPRASTVPMTFGLLSGPLGHSDGPDVGRVLRGEPPSLEPGVLGRCCIHGGR